MSGIRVVLSALILYHLAALAGAAVPAPQALNAPSTVRVIKDAPIASDLTPVLDGAAIGISKIQPIVYRALGVARNLTSPYIEAGLGGQQWSMFSNPYMEDKYLRLDYYVVLPDEASSLRVFRELVLPADREEDVRVVHQYRDKAILNILETYFVGLGRLDGGSDEERELEREFDPIAQYFSQRFLDSREPRPRLLRIELWHGSAPIPPRGAHVSAEALQARLRALDRFRSGSPEMGAVSGGYRRRGAVEREADIVWTLLHIDGPGAAQRP